LLYFLLAAAFFLIAEGIAGSAANGLSSGDSKELVYRCMLLFLLLAGYWAMGYAFQRQRTPLKSMGLIRRPTALREFGVGAAFGWGAMIVCVLPIAVLGGMTLTFWTGPRQLGLLVVDLVAVLAGTLAEEVAFRGYPFQRLIEAMGPVMATLVISCVFGLVHLENPDATYSSTLVTVLAGWLLALAYLRTRALWLPWGLHFAWNASMGILFGLPISGLRTFSPVITANAHGPLWLTGDGYGPEGGLITIFVLLISLGVLTWVTRDFAWQYAQPAIVPGGIPVDIDAAAKQQHEEAMASPAEATPTLVQISPAAPSTAPAPPAAPEDGA
jgi:membrane protease YdiL (CAAX protease family)